MLHAMSYRQCFEMRNSLLHGAQHPSRSTHSHASAAATVILQLSVCPVVVLCCRRPCWSSLLWNRCLIWVGCALKIMSW
jgi:hypothetical protein